MSGLLSNFHNILIQYMKKYYGNRENYFQFISTEHQFPLNKPVIEHLRQIRKWIEGTIGEY